MIPKFPYFSFFPRDWIAGTAELSAEQKGCFIHLLCFAWEQNPPCTLPGDDSSLARLVGLSPVRWRKISKKVREKFEVVENGRLRNPKQWSIYARILQDWEKRSNAGKKGNDIRWGKIEEHLAERPQSDRKAIATGSHPYPDPNADKRSSDANASGASRRDGIAQSEVMGVLRECGFACDEHDGSIVKVLLRKDLDPNEIINMVRGLDLMRKNGDLIPGYRIPTDGELSMRLVYAKSKSIFMPLWSRAVLANDQSKKLFPPSAMVTQLTAGVGSAFKDRNGSS